MDSYKNLKGIKSIFSQYGQKFQLVDGVSNIRLGLPFCTQFIGRVEIEIF
jgi:hypothetical protein